MRLNNYIIENSENIIKIIILTSHKDGGDEEEGLFKTAKIIKNTCKKRNIPYYIVFAENAYIDRDDDNNIFIHNVNDKKGFQIHKSNTVCLVRGSIMRLKSSLDLLSQLEKNDIFCVNNRQTIEECSDKYRTILKIADVGVPAPKTALVTDIRGLENAFERIGGKFPCVLKTLTGSKGIGVFQADSWEGMKSTLQTIWKINPDTEVILQEFINADYDMRIHVLGNKVIAAMKRFKIKKDFRSNYSLGGKVEKTTLTEEQEDIAILAAKAVGAIWAGVDMMEDNEGNLYVIEVNSSPGTEGIMKATGKPIVDMVLDYILDKDHWRIKPIECGYIENINIELLGNYDAKMDTGNSSYCVIHADKWSIKDDYVTWIHNGKSYEHKLETIKNFKRGGLQNKFEERPVILLDVTFNGTLYKDIKFAISNRDGLTQILMNRTFIKMAGLIINPARKYVVSIKGGEDIKKGDQINFNDTTNTF